jgi:hypothetical protein
MVASKRDAGTTDATSGIVYALEYRVVPGHRNWQIETAAWNLAGFWRFF